MSAFTLSTLVRISSITSFTSSTTRFTYFLYIRIISLITLILTIRPLFHLVGRACSYKQTSSLVKVVGRDITGLTLVVIRTGTS